uniref:Methyltransferase n=1 Tax=Streptomyces sp. TP-A0584 TaxID=314563 RepID=A0A6S4QEG6_9ACTN|nr:methyltransferase [Streptomyces sp. TP-A0584]
MQHDTLAPVNDRPYGNGIVTTRDLAAGEVVADLGDCVAVDSPSIYTIEVGPGEHIDGDRVRHLNHSCDPNTYVDTVRLRVVALRPIAAGEELTFFYPSTEWEMVGPFACLCGSAACVGTVSGARDLPLEVLHRYDLNAHITDRLASRAASVR